VSASVPPSIAEGAGGNITALGPPLLTAEQVAAFLGCSVELVYKLRRQGKLKAVKLGALYRWRPEVVRTFVGAAER
jgi:excisionase family DNA binding protein